MENVSMKLPEEVLARLRRLAAKKGTSASSLVREAVAAYLAGEIRHISGSFIDGARDLAGCLAGPGDLSHNKARLRGFGR
ncbi:MAG: ribbon-helix-helix protein, CopG family [Planctomycetes bacterium]|nr:ribbon-helix-helix protein, CopG family [Planctomycetota bacterium]